MEIREGQNISRQDLQFLIAESNRQKRQEKGLRIAQIIVTPLVLALLSTLVTWSINKQQAENTQKLAEEQIRSAEIIAAANREHSAKISESNQRIERIKQMNEVFKTILAVDDRKLTDEDIDSIKMQIVSLEVYEEDALIFLSNIRQFYQNKMADSKVKMPNLAELMEQTNTSINNILYIGQIDLSERVFIECAEAEKDAGERCDVFRQEIETLQGPSRASLTLSFREGQKPHPLMVEFNRLHFNQINLRKQRYRNYNFSGCSFFTVNLYKSDFSACTLVDNLYVDVDFQEAAFSGSNLSGSVFWKCNLQKADFRDARLRDVVMVNPILNRRVAAEAVQRFCKKNGCCELEGAYFSLGSLLWTKSPPFDVFDREKRDTIAGELQGQLSDLYVNLLMPHKENIALIVAAGERGDEDQAEKVAALLKNTGAKNWPQLRQRLERAENREKILTQQSAEKESTAGTVPSL